MPRTYIPVGWGRNSDVVPPHILDADRNRLARNQPASFEAAAPSNPNPPPAPSQRLYDKEGRALVSRREEALRAGLSWEAEGRGAAKSPRGKDGEFGLSTRHYYAVHNASHLQNVRGAMVPTRDQAGAGKRMHCHSPPKPERGTGKTTAERRYASSIKYGACTTSKNSQKDMKAAKRQPQPNMATRESVLTVKENTVTHSGPPEGHRKGRAVVQLPNSDVFAGYSGLKQSPTRGRPTTFVLDITGGSYLDGRCRKGRSMSPQKDTTQLIVPRGSVPKRDADAHTAHDAMITHIKRTAYKRSPAGMANPVDSFHSSPRGKRRVTLDGVRAMSPPKFVSTLPTPAPRPPSPPKRVSITGSPKRQLGLSHKCTARLLAWD